MAYKKILIQPGLNTQATQTLNEGSWSSCNLIKFRNGLLEKIAGWEKLFSQACAGVVRALHAYADVYDTDTLLIAGDGGPQIYADGQLESLTRFRALGTGALFSATVGSPVVTVSSPPFTVTAGEIIKFPQKLSVGGFVYAEDATVEVQSVPTGQFTFNLPAPASLTTTNIDGVPRIWWGKFSDNESDVQVTFYNRGPVTTYLPGKTFFSPGYGPLATFPVGTMAPLNAASVTTPIVNVGGTFAFDIATSFVVTIGLLTFDLSLAADTPYTVTHLIDQNNFVINVPAFVSYPRLSYTHLAGAVFNGVENHEGPQLSLTCETQNFSYFTGGNGFFIPGHHPLGLFPLGGGGQQMLVQVNVPVVPYKKGTKWTLDNFGEYGLYCASGGPIYQYTPPFVSAPGIVDLGPLAPQVNEGMFVAMPQAQVIAFGSEETIGGGAQDPLLVRWSNVGNPYNFVPAVTNQAGSFRLSRGSKCVGGMQAPQTSLIWTDVDLWSMAYVGVGNNDSIYSFNIIGSGCGLLGIHARCVLGQSAYWMGQQTFWVFNSNGVQPIESPVWDAVWHDINLQYASNIVAAANSSTQEVLFFYPSLASGSGENDSYIKYQTIENLWDYGSLGRSAWIDQSVFGQPLGADISGFFIQQHETGASANGLPVSGAFAETGFFDISDGTYMMFIDLIIPDLKWLGGAGYVEITLWAVQTPGDEPVMYGPYPVTPTTGIISTGGVRARSIALRIDWGLYANFNARLGAIRVRTAPAGRV
jgi:hypothetical protein